MCRHGDQIGHRRIGEVAARQVLFQRHVGRGVEDEAAVTRRGLALGARQRVFFLGFRVQEHRKVLAHRPVAGGDHLLRTGAHHHPVLLLGLQAEQGVADRTTYQIALQGEPEGVTGGSQAAARTALPVSSQS